MSRAVRVAGPYMYGLRADSNVGGEVYERLLLERLPDRGIELIMGIPSDLIASDAPAAWQVDRLAPAGSLHWVAATVRFAPYVASLIRAGRVDVLRGHSVRYCGPALLLGRRLARGPVRVRRSAPSPGPVGRPQRVPIVLHHHHLSPRWRRLEARILSAADAVIAVSEHARRELLAAGVPADRINVVLQGVARPPRTDGWEDAWPSAGMRLLALGRLEQRKRPELAIDALASLRRRGIPASLVIAGAGEMSEALTDRVRAFGLVDAVSFLGRVSELDKWRLYDSAGVLLFTSELEGFGVVVAEAQSRGVPVVAASGTATGEAFDPGRTGFLVEPHGDAFADALAHLAHEPVRAAMSEAARAFAVRFDWDRCADAVAAIYRELAAS